MKTKVTDAHMSVLAVPVQAAQAMFPTEPSLALLAVFVLGLDFGRKNQNLATRMSKVGAVILNGNDEGLSAEQEQSLDAAVALAAVMMDMADSPLNEALATADYAKGSVN